VLTALLEAVAITVIAAVPHHLVAALLAAAAFGVAYNTVVAVTILWATHTYADRPAAGVAAVTGAQGVGLLFGPLTAGLLAETTDLTTALLGGAAIVAAAAVLAPRHDVIHDDDAAPARPSVAAPPRPARSRFLAVLFSGLRQ
jgi:MFS family permease